MFFKVINPHFYVNDYPILKEGNPRTRDDIDIELMEIDDDNEEIRQVMHILHKLGFIEIIESHEVTDDITRVEPGETIGVNYIIRNTRKVIKYTGSTAIFEIQIGDKTYRCRDADITNIKSFQTFLINAYSLIFNCKKNEWLDLVSHWLSIAEIREYTGLDEDELTRTKMINYLNKHTIYFYTSNLTTPRKLLYWDKYPDSILVLNEEIYRLFSNDGKVSMRKIAVYLSPLINGNTIRIRIGRQLFRYWRFSIEACDIDLDELLVKEDEENE